MLWQKMNPGTAVPALGDSALQGMVSGIVVEKEQIGSNRYIASLGVLFDRARTGQLLGVRASAVRSPPLLVLPIIWNGGTARVRSEEHTSELQSLMRTPYAVFSLTK